ncbi:MAG: phosphatase PAP2 family protein, partial [Ruminococcus sp.]|nr:phosphatase PAP2 family protein [Ruminococcus sp.]
VKKPSGYSFPSGHSCAAAAFGTVLLAKNKVLGLVFLVPVLYMMFSRCYAYVHFPTDVLAGMLLGILCAVVVLIIFRATKLDRKLSGRK